MERSTVISSNISSIGYDVSTETLEVEFQDGGIYHYFGVPETIYAGLMQAPSKGRYLNEYVKDCCGYERIR